MNNGLIQSYQETIEILSSNAAPLTFERDCIRTRSASCEGWLQHSEGSPLYKILEGGKYEVSFSTNVTSATAGIVALGLYVDGILVPGTTRTTEITTAGTYESISFDKVIPICCRGDATVTIASVPSVLSGATPVATPTVVPTIQNANLIIRRLA